MKVFLFGLGALVLLNCRFCAAQTAVEIIERYIDTVSNGDIDNWRKIKSVLLEREVFYSQEQYDQSGPIFSHSKVHYHKTYRVFPDKLKTEIYTDSSYRELLSSWWYLSDKTIVQFKNMDPIIRTEGNAQDGLWDFRPVEILDLVNTSKSMKYKGITEFELEGVSCFHIEIEKSDGAITHLFFNTRSYLLEFTKQQTESEDLSYGAFSDYKVIDGLLFYTFTQSLKNGRIFFGSKTKRIHLNYPIDNEKFEF